MADAPGTATAAAGPDSPKKKAGREKLIVGGTVVLIVLTYLILRRSSAASSTTSSTVAPGIDPTTGIPYSQEYGGYGYGGGTGYGTTAGSNYLNPQDPTILALEGQISGLQAQLAGNPATASGGTVGTTGGSGSAAQGNPTPGTGAVQVAFPTSAPTGPYAGATVSSYVAPSGESVAYPSWFGSGASGAALASQFQANQAINAKSTPAQQRKVLQQGASDPALGAYLTAVHQAGY